MAERCPNCEKPVLPTDVVCWHCGYQLPRKATAAAAKAPATAEARQTDTRAQAATPTEYDWRALAVYGLLTLAIAVALWLVMRSLSRQPILVSSAGFDFGGEWVTVTDADLRYTVSIPTDWQWIDMAYGDQSELLAEVAARQIYVNRALRPLGELAGDVETVGLAVGTRSLEEVEPQPFVIIGQSARLSGVAPQAALDSLADVSLEIGDKLIDTHLAGQAQARFTTTDPANSYQCRHLFVSGPDTPGYLAAACAPRQQFVAWQRDLNDILDSFQLLEY